jgi:ATPase subunit of ABC transporter with duplicated ATPase domains
MTDPQFGPGKPSAQQVNVDRRVRKSNHANSSPDSLLDGDDQSQLAGRGAIARAHSTKSEPGGRRSVLRVDHLAKRFGGVVALRDVSLRLGKGEAVGLFGDNGSGCRRCFPIRRRCYGRPPIGPQ